MRTPEDLNLPSCVHHLQKRRDETYNWRCTQVTLWDSRFHNLRFSYLVMHTWNCGSPTGPSQGRSNRSLAIFSQESETGALHRLQNFVGICECRSITCVVLAERIALRSIRSILRGQLPGRSKGHEDGRGLGYGLIDTFDKRIISRRFHQEDISAPLRRKSYPSVAPFPLLLN